MRGILRSIWEEPQAPGAPRRTWFDWVLVVGLITAAVVEGIVRKDLQWPAIQIALTVALVPTLLWRRTTPLLAVAVAFIFGGLVVALTGGAVPQLNTLVFLVLLPYSLFRWGSGREVVIGTSIIALKVCVTLLLGDMNLTQSFEAFGVLGAAAAVGVTFRYRAMLRARDLLQVKLLERERLARDLHDTIAHHVSAIAIRAQAGLAASPSQPNAAADALHVIESEATRALAEMRAIVRVLRESEQADLPPNPRISDLEQLARANGSPAVDVEISGDLDDLAPAVGSAIYRLAQESITNARRHARHVTRIKVRVAADDTTVQLRVSDDGEASPTRSAASPGYGVRGMTERAGLLGGTIEAGPNPERGWTVTAILPRTGSPA